MPLMFIAPVRYASQVPQGGQDNSAYGDGVYDYYFPSTTILLHGDVSSAGSSAFIDSSGGTVTASSATTSSLIKKWGSGSLAFTGTNSSHVDLASSPAYALGTGDFTIECWVYLTDFNALNTICDGRTAATNTAFVWRIDYTAGSLPQLAFGIPSISATLGGSYPLSLNHWYHVVVSRRNGTVYQFVNGVCVSAHTGYGVDLGSTSQPMRIGANQSTDGTYGFPGFIDDFRITKGIARYVPAQGITKAFDSTDPYWNNVALLLHGEGADNGTSIVDSSSWNNAITKSGNPITSTEQVKFGTASLKFDGSSYLRAAHALFAVRTGDFTVETWFYPTYLGSNKYLFSTVSSSSGFSGGWSNTIQLGYSSTQLFVCTGSSYNTYNVTWSVNNWYHIALSRRAGVLYVYLNGMCIGSAPNTYDFTAPYLIVGAGYSATGYAISGYLDEFRFTSGYGRYGASFQPKAVEANDYMVDQPFDSTDKYWDKVVLLMHMDGSFADEKGHTVTSNSVTISNSVAKFNSSAYFNGSSTSLYVAHQSDLNIVGDCTLEAWVYPTINNSSTAIILTKGHTSGTQVTSYELGLNAGLLPSFGLGPGTGVGGLVYASSTEPIPLNQWTHIAGCVTGTKMVLLVNGVLKALNTAGGRGNNSTALTIGKRYSNDYYFTGYIDEVRITNGVARYIGAMPQIVALPNNDLTDGLNTSTVFDLAISGDAGSNNDTFTDSSTNNFALTRTGRVGQGSFTPYGTNWSLELLGNTSYAQFPNSTALQMGTGDFTIEGWIFPTVAPTSVLHRILCLGGQNVSSGLIIMLNSSYQIKVDSGSSTVLISTNYAPLNTWTHFALVRSGTVVTLYMNGVASGSATFSTNHTFTSPAQIGYDSSLGTGSGADFIGLISNIRIIKGSALYTAEFAPPDSPLAAVPGTTLLAVNSGMAIDGSSNKAPLTLIGSVWLSPKGPFAQTANYSPSALSGGSIAFDGSGNQYLTTSVYDSTKFDWWTSDFTLEAWVYVTAATGYTYSSLPISVLMGNRSPTATTSYWSFGPNANNKLVFQYTSGGSPVAVISTNSVPVGAWTHIAMVNSGSSIQLFINGVPDTVATYGTPQSSEAYPLTVGCGSASSFKGYVTDIRLTKGVALYGASGFSVPTAPLQALTGTNFLLNGTNSSLYDNTGKFDIATINTTVDTTKSRSGKCLAFNGSSSYIALAGPSWLSTGDFSIEFWVNPTVPTVPQVLLNQWLRSSGSYVVGQFEVVLANSTTIQLIVATGASSATTYSATVPALQSRTWYHLAFIRVRGVLTISLNGIVYYKTSSTITVGVKDESISFGVQVSNMSSYFTGYLEGLRLTSAGRDLGPLWAYDNDSLWDNITPPTQAFGDLGSTDYFYDQSSAGFDFESASGMRGRNLTLVGSGALSSTKSKFGTQSLYCPGSGNYGATFPLDTLVMNPKGDFTLEMWVYPTSYSSTYNNGIYVGGANSSSYNIYLYVSPSGGSLGVYWYSGSGGSDSVSGSPGPALNTWSHIAFVRKGSSYSLYLNGTRVAQKTSTVLTLKTPTSPASLGYYPDGITNWKGYIDDFKITNHAKYTGQYITIPSSPQVVSSTDPTIDPYWKYVNLIVPFEGTIKDESSNKAITNTNVTLSTSVKKSGSSSGYFSGTGSCSLSIAGCSAPGSSFTLEFWFRLDNSVVPGDYNTLWDTRSVSNSATGVFLTYNALGQLAVKYNLASDDIPASVNTALMLNQWQHVALVRNGSTLNLFIDGVLVDQNTSFLRTLTDANFLVGRSIDLTYGANGYMDNLRYTPGVARYQGNFVPPSYELPLSN